MAAPPAITVIVPVYGVADDLPSCLDSILAHPGADDIEVIAVDDASPDGCGKILDDRAAADPRLKVLHLEINGGQGNARNLALQQAVGDYVWFVDADDLVADGAFAAIDTTLAGAKPDVLLIDWVSDFPGGRTEPNVNRAWLARVPPDGCTLADHPGLINLTMTSWSKLFRRDFLLGLDVSFAAGIHEDIRVTCAAMLSADVICAVDQVCYRYRRGRPGQAMRTTSHGQWAVFDAYEQVFGMLATVAAAGQPVSDGVEAAVFERAIWHYSTVLGATRPGIGRIGLPGLVPRAERKQFFARMHADFRRYRPDSYHHPGGPRGAKLRLVERGAYLTYSVLEPLNQTRVAARNAVRRLRH